VISLLLGLALACVPVPMVRDSGGSIDSPTGDTHGSRDTGFQHADVDSGETGDTAPPIDSALFGIDTDGDGLSDGQELQLGWDPESTDTDSDGFGDAEEHAAGTDGALPWSWPLDGCRWPDLRDEGVARVGSGAIGWGDREAVPDLTFTDQCGGEVSLWQFPGHVIVLDMAATWCAPCQEAAPMLQSRFEAFRDRGFLLLTGLQGATLEETQAWADSFGSTHPVAADTDRLLFGELEARTTTYPSYVLIDTDLVVRSLKVGEAEQSWFDLFVPGLQDERDAVLE
jgi:peroxiredoxin